MTACGSWGGWGMYGVCQVKRSAALWHVLLQLPHSAEFCSGGYYSLRGAVHIMGYTWGMQVGEKSLLAGTNRRTCRSANTSSKPQAWWEREQLQSRIPGKSRGIQ